MLRPGGRDGPEAVVSWIAPRSEALALFAATLGGGVSREIERLSAAGAHPLAVALDAAASCMASRCADHLAAAFQRHLAAHGAPAGLRVLPYSPGYCGWPVTGQRALFARLRPERIGIRLGSGCLMRPVKSVSGVLVAALPAVHRFEPGFPYCASCRDRSCTERMRSLAPSGEA